jgi:hypothetical protein
VNKEKKSPKTTMVLSSTLDYIAQPLEAMDINMLRNAAICGVTALVIVMVGLSKLLILVFYLLMIGIITAITWLYSLERIKRELVVQRIKEVFNSFVQTCVDQVLKEQPAGSAEKSPNGSPSTEEPVRRKSDEGGYDTVDRDRFENDSKTPEDFSSLFE